MKYDDVQQAVQSPHGTSAVVVSDPLGPELSQVERSPAGTRPSPLLSEDSDIGEWLSLEIWDHRSGQGVANREQYERSFILRTIEDA